MTTEDECVHALREAAQIIDESPTKAQYEALDLTPSASTILRQCGGWNAAKERAGLETYYSRGNRVAPKPPDVVLPEGVAWEELSRDQRWHYKNVDWNTRRSLKRRRRLREWVNDLKRDRGCDECGRTDPVILDFHHRSPKDKTMQISDMVTYGYGREKLRTEMEKCSVLCSNCHQKEHAAAPASVEWMEEVAGDSWLSSRDLDGDLWFPRETGRQRAWLHKYKRLKGCSRCAESNPLCLDFHHLGAQEKGISISKLITNGCLPVELRAEIQKCVVLCANCHRREHRSESTLAAERSSEATD